MAKAPIIISNGGIAEELAKGLVPATGVRGKAEEIILRNVEELNERMNKKKTLGPRPVAMSLEYPARARIYWRLDNEEEHENETGAGAH